MGDCGARKELSLILADWPEEYNQADEGTTHLWEESWDDDATSEEFLAQLKWGCLRHRKYRLTRAENR